MGATFEVVKGHTSTVADLSDFGLEILQGSEVEFSGHVCDVSIDVLCVSGQLAAGQNVVNSKFGCLACVDSVHIGEYFSVHKI